MPPRCVRRDALIAGWVVLGVLVQVLAAMASGGVAGDVPRLELSSENRLGIAGLPSILDDTDVRRALDSGLTTTFQFSLDLRLPSGSRVRGGALVEVRYEPWDEVYHLMAIGVDGRVMRSVEASFETLTQRWSDLRLVLLLDVDAAREQPLRPRLALDVIPFSRGEQRDTQRWLADSLHREPSNAERAARSSEERAAALAEAVQLLVATSIRRQAILSYDWRPAVATEKVR